MQPARLDLSVIQGATFRQVLRIMQPELAYRPITAIASTSPVRLTVDHDLPTDWPVWVRGVTGLPVLNKEVPRQLPHLAQVVDAGHIDINSVPATGAQPKGGELSYYLPVNLTGVVATLLVLDSAGAQLLSVQPTVHAGGWVEVLLTDEETEALTWKEGAWQLDLAFTNGESYRAFAGKATVWAAGTAPTATCEGAWVLTAGGQGAPGEMGPAFQVDAFGPLAERDQYDDQEEGFAFLATDNGLLYLREGAPGGWSDGVPFQGPAGRSITSVAVNGSGHLIITYSDGTTSDAGAIPPAPIVWGSIGGTLVDQDDLALALAGKATAAQGAKADSAVQPGDLAPVATSGSYVDLTDKPFIPATAGDVGAATSEQGAKADTAVQPALLDAGLDEKVDKLTGYGLSQENFTAAEKSKLAGLESSHFKGVFADLAALEAALPTAVAGDYADVDAGEGSDTLRYIWDVSDAEWVLSGSGAPLTAAQIKTLYESNPDTNAFTDAEEAKLAGVATGATKNSNTDELAEGSTNQYFTAARVRAVVLTGLSLATNAAITAADTVLGALGKLQAQITAHFGAGGGAHADATTSVAGFMSGADKTKLNGVAAGATANDTDSNLKNRANHTGSQAISTVTGLQPALDAKLAVAGGTLSGALNEAPGAPLASAGTVNIGAAAANTINISGTTTITAFDTIAAGAKRTLVFQGVLTLTHHGTSLILPGGLNVTTEAGDSAVFESLGSGNWRCVEYLRRDGSVFGRDPCVRAYQSSPQSIPNTAFTKVLFDTETADPRGFFDTTNSRFQPTKKGRYLIISGLVYLHATADAGKLIVLAIYKNGVRDKNLAAAGYANDTSSGMNGAAVVELNGTTDYAEVFTLQSAGSAKNTQGTAPTVFFQAEYLGE